MEVAGLKVLSQLWLTGSRLLQVTSFPTSRSLPRPSSTAELEDHVREATQPVCTSSQPRLVFLTSRVWCTRPRMLDLWRTAPSLTSTCVETAPGLLLRSGRLPTVGQRRISRDTLLFTLRKQVGKVRLSMDKCLNLKSQNLKI